MVVEKGDQRHQRRCVVVGVVEVVVARLNLAGVAAGGGEDAVDLIVQRVIQHRLHLVVYGGFCAGVGTAFCIGAIVDFTELKKVRLVGRYCRRADPRAPVVPESHFNMLDRIDAVGIEADALDPVGKNFRHAVAHIACLGAEIVEREKLAVFDLGRIAPVLCGAIVVKQCFERYTKRRVVEWRCIAVRAVVAQRVPIGRIFEIWKPAIAAVDDGAAVVHDHIIDHQNPTLVRCIDETFQVVERSHPRIGLIKVGGRVAVVIAIAVEQDRRNPYRGGSQ